MTAKCVLYHIESLCLWMWDKRGLTSANTKTTVCSLALFHDFFPLFLKCDFYCPCMCLSPNFLPALSVVDFPSNSFCPEVQHWLHNPSKCPAGRKGDLEKLILCMYFISSAEDIKLRPYSSVNTCFAELTLVLLTPCKIQQQDRYPPRFQRLGA